MNDIYVYVYKNKQNKQITNRRAPSPPTVHQYARSSTEHLESLYYALLHFTTV